MNHALYSRVAAPLATHINELAVNFVESHSPVVAQDEGRGGLPAIIVAPVMLATYAIELLTAGIANTTVVSIFGAFALVDWLLDVLFMFTLGFLCKPCASIFIWLINLAYLPIYFAAWAHRFIMETFGLIFDGWLLIFNFSGCYMFIGRHCGLLNPRFTPWRFDIPILNSLGMGEGFIATIKSLTKPPEINTTSDILKVRHNQRMNMFQGTPVMGTLLALADKVVDHIHF